MDDVLKQRLIGAALLLALAVIFIPMLFDGPPDPRLERTLDPAMPDSPLADRPVRRLPLNPSSRTESDEEVLPTVTEAVTVPEPIPSEEAEATQRMALDETPTESGSVSEPEPTELEQPVDAADDSSSNEAGVSSDEITPPPEAVPVDWAEGWRVQVASFGAESTATEVAATLEQAGFGVRIDRIERGQSVLFRVQTGPYVDQEAAERALVAIDDLVSGVNPVTQAPRSLDAEALEVPAGFAVQVGVFTAKANAERLEQQLKTLGFDAFHFTEVAGGRTLWRVRVGTVPNREQAEALSERLRSEAGLEGLVVSHP